ncbi:MAG: glucose-1-phosphate adenylyltransferase [Verrucomicrobiae bacterium]|nr:glucose-1-phosphate adenylyltransferase [Verrucomicrobiae bacterium]
MKSSVRQAPHNNNVLVVIMGGGQGTRLFPLTRERAKPAVPLAGKYRLVDIPISNCINSNLKRVYLLTQFNSASLHRHITQSYKFDHFSGGFVEVLAAEQTPTSMSWYQGTADAVRKNLVHFMDHHFEYMLILSGDQLYRMDFRAMLEQHANSDADVTIGAITVGRHAAEGLGIMQIDENRRIVKFVEKPKDQQVLDSLKLDKALYEKFKIHGDADYYLASMGIYVFSREVIFRLLDNSYSDFGKHIIPLAIQTSKVNAYIFQGYWEDIGTIKSFFEANLDAVSELPRFNYFDTIYPIYTRPRFLPPSKINGASINHAIISDGCIINHASIDNSIIGLRGFIDAGSYLHRVIMLGSDYYESAESIERNAAAGRPRIGVGKNTRVENAILDKNVRIGDNVVISPAGKPPNVDHPLYYIRDGIVIIPKNGVVPSGTII